MQSPLMPFVDALPLPPRRLADEHQGWLRVHIRAASHRFHRDLPQSRVWTYDGSVPGPTIEAERGHPVRVEWRNELAGTLPVTVTLAPTETDGDGVPVQCLPGLSGGVPDADAASLPGLSVVHLHGGLTAAAYDGWAENIFAPGQHAVGDYAMDQRAALLWYHDHVMSVTRFTVYAGLAGLWIVRDERERDLGLPEGPPLEVPLLLQDRNFGQDPDGRLTGELVHKTDPGTMEAFAPFTVVNGKVWPVLEVQPATYRLRVINGSNARTFRLVLLRDGRPELDRITQIGTDSGLLPAPVAVPADGLVLASAERADLLVDFPDVMRFRAAAGPPARRPRPQRLATDLTAPTRADLSGAVRRAVALVEQELEDMPNILTMRELAEASDYPDDPVMTVVDQDGTTVARLRTVAIHFEDAATFFPMLGGWEVWQLLNLTGGQPAGQSAPRGIRTPNRQIRSHRPPVPSRPPRPFASPSAQLSGHAYGLSRASVPACPAPHGRNLVAVSGHHCQTRCLAACLVKHLRNAPSTRFKVWCPSFRSKDTDRAWSARGAQTLATADRAASWGRDSATRRWGSGQLPLTSPGASTSPRQPGELLALRVGLHQPWL